MPQKLNKLKPSTIFIAIMVIGFVVGAFSGFISQSDIIVPNWLVLIVVIPVIAGSILYWRLLDETAKEAHKFSWYWGSTFGIIIITVFCLMPLAGLNSMHFFSWVLPDSPTPQDIFFSGVYGAILTQVICYGIIWFVWWWRMR